ncbi:hypothetical protein [Lactobacillus mulieris]|uniref:DUF5590 domain-containing protein n=1 Tax=Lactobacillus mulieris TaxID=2508708 RepID=A0AAW5WW94_9LACO|nr:hypothetical protein [Lactobacillus mulieris]MCZ3621575.1 hypothetical protein [Lactobacillus mulieris]MCZ3623149.1 hypothetical protein [Lactobacillus mulieris]MCZ3635582.1 hypothetical protein [Lactobacillus mulieris]MCZ3689310.1 hypothetical protein [Lactobacillus mulieris]MCZ3695313.1 hypothetical protein [Lactobacillus mulieris]
MYLRNRIWKYVFAAVAAVVVLIIAFYTVLGLAAHGQAAGKVQAANRAVKYTAIKKVTDYYHLNRGVNSYAVKGQTAKGKTAYYIYLTKQKKGHYLLAKKGYSASQVAKKFSKQHSDTKANGLNLGWYNNEAVWEIAYRKYNGKYGYAIYSFRTGKELSFIDNV